MTQSTIKLSNETKQKLIDLPFVKKGMSFEQIVLELIKHYPRGKRGD